MKKGIYKITNPIGQIYIGQSIDIKSRWAKYKTPSYVMRNKNKLSKSFSLYGVKNHLFEILCECDNKDLLRLEREYQEKFDVLGGKGLNSFLNETSEKKRFIHEDIKIKFGNGNRGKKLSEEQKEKIRNSFTKEVRQKIAKGAEKLFIVGFIS